MSEDLKNVSTKENLLKYVKENSDKIPMIRTLSKKELENFLNRKWSCIGRWRFLWWCWKNNLH